MGTEQHIPVLLEEAIEALVTRKDGRYVDGTFGRGGHSRALVARLNEQGRLLALDKDPRAIEAGRESLGSDDRVTFVQGSFADLEQWILDWGVGDGVDGILLDLGVSSPQLDDPERGFSFQEDGPLDMRMDPTRGVSAAEWLNEAPEREISRVLWEFGEERHARRIARKIVRAREQKPLERTSDLAALIESVLGRPEKKHPATRTFQAIRIQVNNEMADLAKGLDAGIRQLRPGGRLVVISFHSLEDRLVKRTFREAARPGPVRRGLPEPPDWVQRLKLVGKPVKPSDTEVSANPRARSAVMRVAEKVG